MKRIIVTSIFLLTTSTAHAWGFGNNGFSFGDDNGGSNWGNSFNFGNNNGGSSWGEGFNFGNGQGFNFGSNNSRSGWNMSPNTNFGNNRQDFSFGNKSMPYPGYYMPNWDMPYQAYPVQPVYYYYPYPMAMPQPQIAPTPQVAAPANAENM